MATHSSILAWEISWTEEPGRLQSMFAEESDTIEQLHSRRLWRPGLSRTLPPPVPPSLWEIIDITYELVSDFQTCNVRTSKCVTSCTHSLEAAFQLLALKRKTL